MTVRKLDEPRGTVTLGSMNDLQLNGRLIDDVCGVLKGWSGVDKRKCRDCRKRLRGIVGDGSRPIRARIKDPNDALTECDECYDKRTEPRLEDKQ